MRLRFSLAAVLLLFCSQNGQSRVGQPCQRLRGMSRTSTLRGQSALPAIAKRESFGERLGRQQGLWMMVPNCPGDRPGEQIGSDSKITSFRIGSSLDFPSTYEGGGGFEADGKLLEQVKQDLRAPASPVTVRDDMQACPEAARDTLAQGAGTDVAHELHFKRDDAKFLAMMAECERAFGNFTGVEMLMRIAEKMQPKIDESRKQKWRLRADKRAQKDREWKGKKQWPTLDSRLSTDGPSVWVTAEDIYGELDTRQLTWEPWIEGPKSARGATPFENGLGKVTTCTVRVKEVSGVMKIGLTSVSVDMDKAWDDDLFMNEAIFVTQNGNIYNGGQLMFQSGRKMKAGDTISITIEQGIVYFSLLSIIGGNSAMEVCQKFPASQGPVSAALRLSVQLDMPNDMVSLEEQFTNEQNDSRSLEHFGTEGSAIDEASMLLEVLFPVHSDNDENMLPDSDPDGIQAFLESEPELGEDLLGFYAGRVFVCVCAHVCVCVCVCVLRRQVHAHVRLMPIAHA